ncbi:MAG: hypothetical protein PSV13_08080 [Lacunisphaera sp.]|nr:hypothetical protein [Lacunisphaera sp.]
MKHPLPFWLVGRPARMLAALAIITVTAARGAGPAAIPAEAGTPKPAYAG